jgi:serine/threonine-protein kinase
VGRAYGLAGDHRQWALVPQQELARQIAEAMPRAMAPKVSALDVAADPFAAGGGAASPPMSGGRAMDAAFGAVREADLVPDGLPGKKPGWLVPVLVGLVALVVGGAVTLVVMMTR